MRLLIFLLALMSAFFVSAEPDLTDLKPAKELGDSFCQFSLGNLKNVSLAECGEHVISKVKARPPYPTEVTLVLKELPTSPGNMWFEVDYDDGDGDGIDNGAIYTSNLDNPTYSCPPDGFSDYYIAVGEGSSMMCAKDAVPQDCPAGYHSKAVSKALGSSDCVPKECPPAGSGEALYSSPSLGSAFSGGGMYCNDGCAYSVSGSNITSEKHATGTSQGAACGDKPYDNKKLADEGDNDKCSTASNGDVTILSCEAANPTNDPKDPLNNDGSKTGDDPTQDKPKETCTDGDTVCNLKNLEIQMQNSAQQTIDNQNELHNKQVDVQTKNTQAIIDSIDGLDTSIYLQTQQDERLHAVTVSKFNELIDAVNGIENGGGGGSGGGNGSGNGEPDCEGSAADCVPIEGSELSVETVNLEQYADKYDDWLPNAELPDEKCIVLTTGKSICLSFEAFILLFKAISGLLVIGALMHSAKIISGAI